MQVVSRTHVGLVRENNEDALLVREPNLFAVADGMGGYAAGEIASRATVKAFEAATHSLRHAQGEENIRQILTEAFTKANLHVYKMAVSNDKYAGMGTTMTAVYLPGDGYAYCAHIGDSRLYLYRDGVLLQQTRDHTYVADLLEQGKITEDEALVHPQRHMLMQAMGVDENIDVDYFRFVIVPGDRLLLCSDGLTDMVTKEEMTQAMVLNLEKAADALLESSLNNGGRDNVSLIVIEITEEKATEEDNDNERE